uniref:Uncharacterized protein n=1 Tax=Knipowitschia caucasica TaxID=637954 RepID=A0AAV2IUE9_KNICA
MRIYEFSGGRRGYPFMEPAKSTTTAQETAIKNSNPNQQAMKRTECTPSSTVVPETASLCATIGLDSSGGTGTVAKAGFRP